MSIWMKVSFLVFKVKMNVKRKIQTKNILQSKLNTLNKKSSIYWFKNTIVFDQMYIECITSLKIRIAFFIMPLKKVSRNYSIRIMRQFRQQFFGHFYSSLFISLSKPCKNQGECGRFPLGKISVINERDDHLKSLSFKKWSCTERF